MSIVYVFEGKVIKYGGGRYVIYPPKDYQEKLRRLHGERVKVIVIKETDIYSYSQVFADDVDPIWLDTRRTSNVRVAEEMSKT
jgi:hypothetical protein